MSEQQAAFLGDRSLVVDSRALAAIGFDAVLAGHFHRPQELSLDPLVAYCGSIERVDFAEEGEDKSFLVIDTDALPAFERVPTPAREYVTLRGSDIEQNDSEVWLTRDVTDAVVRVLDVDPAWDTSWVREVVEHADAFAVTEVRHARVEAPVVGGLAESLTPFEALDAYFADADEPDRDELVKLGREILAEVAA